MRGRGERADDALRALRASMGRSLVSTTGTHYDFDDLLVEPHAFNEHVPFWIGGRSRRSLQRAVALGDGWAPFGLRSRRPGRVARRGGSPGWLRGGGPARRRRGPGRRARAGGRAAGAVGERRGHRRRPAPRPPLAGALPRAARRPRVVNAICGRVLLADVGSGQRRRRRLPALAPPRPPAGAVLDPRDPARHPVAGRRRVRRHARSPPPPTSHRSATSSATSWPSRSRPDAHRLRPSRRRLAEEGRYPEPATPHLLGAFELHRAYAAPSARVSAEAVPFRPHRGVYLVVERPAAEAGSTAGGGGTTRSTSRPSSRPRGSPACASFRQQPGPRRGSRSGRALRHGRAVGPRRPHRSRWCTSTATSRTTAARLAPLVRRALGRTTRVTPRLAGPFRSPVAYEAWPAGSVGSSGARRPGLPLLADHPRRRPGSGPGAGPIAPRPRPRGAGAGSLRRSAARRRGHAPRPQRPDGRQRLRRPARAGPVRPAAHHPGAAGRGLRGAPPPRADGPRARASPPC